MEADESEGQLRCLRCGGDQIIPHAMIEDSGEHSHRKLHTLVALGNPDALLYVNPIRAELRATICCSCGHVELSVIDPDGLWQKYVDAPDQKRP